MTTQDMRLSIEKFLDRFPVDATSWAQATDEIRDLCRSAKELYNTVDLDLQEEEEFASKGLGALDFQHIAKYSTPAEWNRQGRWYVLTAFDLMEESTKVLFYETNKDLIQS